MQQCGLRVSGYISGVNSLTQEKYRFTAFNRHTVNSVGMLLIKQLLLSVARVKSTEDHRSSISERNLF